MILIAIAIFGFVVLQLHLRKLRHRLWQKKQQLDHLVATRLPGFNPWEGLEP